MATPLSSTHTHTHFTTTTQPEPCDDDISNRHSQVLLQLQRNKKTENYKLFVRSLTQFVGHLDVGEVVEGVCKSRPLGDCVAAGVPEVRKFLEAFFISPGIGNGEAPLLTLHAVLSMCQARELSPHEL